MAAPALPSAPITAATAPLAPAVQDHSSHGSTPIRNAPTAARQITVDGHNSLAWGGQPYSVADVDKSRGVYDRLKALAAQYPTEASLIAAGWTQTSPTSKHYTPPKSVMDGVLNDGVTHMQHLVVKDGLVIGAQFNSSKYDLPPEWGGLWHRHDDKAKESDKLWMAHIYIDRPFQDAFAL